MIAESHIEAEELSLYQFSVHPPARQQLCVRALLDDTPFLDDDDTIRLLDRAETMGDDDDSTSLQVLVKRFLHL